MLVNSVRQENYEWNKTLPPLQFASDRLTFVWEK